MASSLSPERRAQLTDIVQKMQENGESDEYIQSAVDLFKTKYAGMAGGPPPIARKDLLSMVPVPLPGGGGFTDLGSVSRNLPAGLGLTGGVLGGPVLGGAGAAVGDLGRQALEGETISPKRALGRGAMEAGSQLAGLGVGAGLAYGANKVGPRLAAQAAKRLASGKGGGLGLELPGMGFLLGGGHGAAAGGAAAVGKAIATNPHVQKQLARALSSGALQRALIHGGPRAAAAVLNAYISEQDSTR